VLHEYYVSVTQRLKPGLDRDTARADVRDLSQWTTATSTTELLESAWTLQDQFRVAWWDSLVLAAAQLAGCSTLLSEDFQHGQDFAGVRVANPFRTTPRA
jgi:predicted nucleic acid-binding protein